VQAGELPVATALVTVVQIATKLGVIDILIHFSRHFQDDQTGGVVAAAATGTVVRGAQRAGEAEVQGGAEEPTEAAVDIALRRQLNGMGRKVIVREPATGSFGEWRGEGLPVVLVEGLGLGDQGVEIKGRELLGGKR
jgi:hypothetical protein